MAKVARPWIRFTYKDYKSLPESETKRYELLDGALLMTPSPTTYHQRIIGKIYVALVQHVERQQTGAVYLAPIDVVLGEDVVQPDILFVETARLNIIRKEAILGAPDLVVEVLSKSTAERDLSYKRKLYALHGVREYWIVDPEANAIEMFVFAASEDQPVQKYQAHQTVNSRVLEGLTFPLTHIF